MSIDKLRVELYKLHYFDSLFDLNVKADSAELLTVLLKLIHGCYIDPLGRLRTQGGLDDELDSECSKDCIVHKIFFLNLTMHFECKCRSTRNLDNYTNNFSHIINGNELLELMQLSTI